jgi:hypothetical protein
MPSREAMADFLKDEVEPMLRANPTLISPLIRWETIVEEYRDAVHALEAGDPSLIQVWENSRMGKVYSGRVEKIERGEFYERRECFS